MASDGDLDEYGLGFEERGRPVQGVALHRKTDQALVHQFLDECREAGVYVQIFGVGSKLGILTNDQVNLFLDVGSGGLAPDALTDLLPNGRYPLIPAQLRLIQELMNQYTIAIGLELYRRQTEGAGA